MPIYEYRCRECGHEFETMQRVGAGPLRKCPECSGRLEKLISRTSFQLKGGGWYAQGYSGSSSSSGKGDGESKTKKSEPAKKPEKAKKSKD